MTFQKRVAIYEDVADKNVPPRKVHLDDVGGVGGVDTANSPGANEFARFTDADTIEGRTAAEARADLDLEVGVDVPALSHTHAWADVTGEPTTLSGYGITDGATDAELSAAISAHEAASNPHPGYLTPAEGDAAYDAIGAAAAAQAASQPASANLTEYAAVNPTAAGLALLDDADAAAQRTTMGAAASSHTHAQSDVTDLTTDLAAKQATLVSGTNIKTINGSTVLGSGDLAVSGVTPKRVVGMVFDGGGSPPTAGSVGYIVVPFAGTIDRWDIVADASGSAVVDIWKAAGAVPTDANRIAGTEKLTLSAQQLANDTSLTTWSTLAVAIGDVIGFELESVATCTRIVAEVRIQEAA